MVPCLAVLKAGWALATRPRFNLSEVFSIIDTRRTEQVRSLSFETADPTSVEFQDVFREIMEEALCRPDRLVVLVLDNLDRVPTKDALSIWATLQTFMPAPGTRRPNWANQVWVIVPYDRSAIEKLWSAGTGGAPSGAEGETLTPVFNDGADTAAAFLNKTFQVRIEVPPAVISTWRGYLNEKLSHAFPDHDPEDFHLVYRVVLSMGESTTPRNLKTLINEMGVLHRQWSDEIPLSDMCYYVILRRRKPDMISGIIDKEIPEEAISRLLGGGLMDSLAQLRFNVSKSLAREFLLAEPIREAIRSQNGDEFTSLASQYPAGFWPVFELVQSELTSQTDLLNLGRVLQHSKLLESSSGS
jgi:hypothetical protein